MNINELYTAFRQSTGVTTDTRSIKGGELFVALRGDRFDGNAFVDKALEAGCSAAITDHPATAEKHPNAILVENGLTALQELARHHRAQLSGTTVIGLTGSNGKTTSKELIRDVLASSFPTYATKGNLNNHIGVPLSVLEITAEHRFAVIEMGANAQGEIALLSSICMPNFGYITNIGKAHLEGFGGLEGVKKGKSELFKHLRSTGGRVFINAADPVMLELSQGNNRILFGTEVDSPDVYIVEPSPTLSIGWSHHSYFSGKIKTQLTGDYNLGNFAAAIAIGRYFDVAPDAINMALSSYTPENNRSERRSTAKNTVILDAYNANPSSMAHALRSFANDPAHDKLCILGDMFELGEASDTEHRAIVQLADELKLPYLLAGSYFKASAHDLTRAFETTEALATWLTNHPVAGKTILLKGSRGMRLEQLLPLL
jgi:UDP-N-acetylmuramoyl-tripeptide--D-alanyl-D-alanine ligase